MQRGRSFWPSPSHGAPELMTPADVLVVEKMPLLGSGKIDNLELARLVRGHVKANTSA